MKRPGRKETRKPKQDGSFTLRCQCGCDRWDVVQPSDRFGVERVKCARCGGLWPFAK